MIVVDASVAVKWIVEEELHSEALSIVEGDFTLVAPNLVVVETLNVLRRKVKRAEITPAQFEQAGDELADVFELLVSESTLASSIALLSTTLDHSVYDCAYLACALKYDAPLVTADARFARKVQTSAFRDAVVQLGSHSVEVLTVNLAQKSLGTQALQLYRTFEQTVAHVRGLVARPFGPHGGTLVNTGDLKAAFDSPSYVRLRRFIAALSQAEQARLLATAWFGRSHVKDTWEKVLADATEYVAVQNAEPASYIIQTLATLAAGLEKLSRPATGSSADRT